MSRPTHSRSNMMRRLMQVVRYAAAHPSGFYNKELSAYLGIGEEPIRKWLLAAEEAGFLWRWRRFDNEPYLWRATFTLHERPCNSSTVSRRYTAPLKGAAKVGLQS